MCFITVNDIEERLQKPQYATVLGDMIRLELPPESNEDDWPCVTAVLVTGQCKLLWAIYARGNVRNNVLRVLEAFNDTLG